MLEPEHENAQRFTPSTRAELVGVFGCTTRLQILVVLATEGPSDVRRVAERCGHSESLASSHLHGLRALGLCDYEIEGRRHVYRLSDPRSVRVTGEGFEFHLTGGDGSRLSLCVPSTSPDCRLIRPSPPHAAKPVAVGNLSTPIEPKPSVNPHVNPSAHSRAEPTNASPSSKSPLHPEPMPSGSPRNKPTSPVTPT